ncbi:MAG: hypothetical protein GF347_00760 [Candidatus Moranbacteria bacterium]|nr:hypothetical protein [Candidatus Moranbacteria bacterium]
MKKILIGLLFVFLLAGCGEEKSQKTEKKYDENSRIKIALIADIHYCSTKGDLNNIDQLEQFSRNLNSYNTDFNFNLGDNISLRVRDCTKNGKKDLARVFEVFNGSEIKFYQVLGDHDIKNFETYNQWLEYSDLKNSYYSLDYEAFHIIVLDTVTGGRQMRKDGKKFKFRDEWSQGQLLEEQLEWLREDLANTDRNKIIILSGQPLYIVETHDKNGDHVFGVDEGREEAVKILKETQKEIVAVSGDAHVWRENKDANITHYVIGSFGYSGGEWALFEWGKAGHSMIRQKLK